MWISIYVGTGAFARPAKRSEASRYHDPLKLKASDPKRGSKNKGAPYSEPRPTKPRSP